MQSNTEIILPETFKAIIGHRDGKTITVEDIPLPKLGVNEVLVRIDYAPINPSDLGTAFGGYGGAEGKTRVGFEGSGVIAAIGENLKVPHKVGEKVHVKGVGTWAQYIVTDSESVWPIIAKVSQEEAACHFVNPATVVCMADVVEKSKSKAAIHTAGASALGRMMIRYFKAKGIKLINTVRKQEYVDELLKEGADYVLNTTDPEFPKKLKEIAEKENVLTAFDAVASDLTGTVLAAMPNDSTIYVYGGLAGGIVNNIRVEDLISRGKKVEGLYLGSYLKVLTPEQVAALFKEAHSHLDSTLKSNIQKVFSLDQWPEALTLYQQSSSKGKILFKPN